MSGPAAVERHLTYLLQEEKEERNERRGLEQRAGGLIAALLLGFPVAGTVAKNADLGNASRRPG